MLFSKKESFEKNNIFPKGTIDRFISQLKSYKDSNLSEELFGKDEEIQKLVENTFIICK
ncbi:MAG: hypothetical protein R2942_19515 [Ignavibacteria bacterium]